ncbi:MAG: cyclic nucleotide-binding domain-containing protein, partial [Flavobacterium piscis]|nr:cyclic nucleotide-binding domain-containing protein [Flavobacterium piscis]
MHKSLLQHIEKIVELEPIEIDLLDSCLSVSTIKRKELVLEEGQIFNKIYFIVKGCMRQYIINTKGTEQTLQFGIENW